MTEELSMGFLNVYHVLDVRSYTLFTDTSCEIIYWLTQLSEVCKYKY